MEGKVVAVQVLDGCAVEMTIRLRHGPVEIASGAGALLHTTVDVVSEDAVAVALMAPWVLLARHRGWTSLLTNSRPADADADTAIPVNCWLKCWFGPDGKPRAAQQNGHGWLVFNTGVTYAVERLALAAALVADGATLAEYFGEPVVPVVPVEP